MSSSSEVDANRQRFRNFMCVWLLQAVDALDASLVSPSMSEYIRSLDGSRAVYGQAISLFFVGRILGLPLFGLLADYVSFESAFKSSLLLGVVGGLVYALAGLFKALWFILLSRFILGASTGVISAAMAFAGAAAAGEQTKFSGITVLVYNVVTVVAPALGSLLTVLPHEGTAFNSYTYCGYALMVFNVISLLIHVKFFQEPDRSHLEIDGIESSLLGGPAQDAELGEALEGKKSILGKICFGVRSLVYELVDMAKVLRQTGAWVTFVTSSQNSFNQLVVQWGLPIVTYEYFGWGQRMNGVLLMGTSVVGLVGLPLLLRNLHHLSDRSVFVSFQTFVGISLLLFSIYAGCSHSHQLTPVILCITLGLWGFGTFGQVPGNMGLFSKLLGARKQGKFQAILFMTMSLARVIAGSLIGVSDGPAGTCTIYAAAFVFWILQFAFYLPMWPHFHPDLLKPPHAHRHHHLSNTEDSNIADASERNNEQDEDSQEEEEERQYVAID